jgi:RimJ/RimL family protein N-acetyltransferase
MIVPSGRTDMQVQTHSGQVVRPPAAVQSPVSADWRRALPVLRAGAATLRQLNAADAASLLDVLTTEEVTRFISPPPSTIAGFERFIAWTLSEQACGRYICFGIIPEGCERAVGIIQVRQLEPGFGTAEWGFALGSSFWGTGLFHASAEAVIEFAFEHVGVHRLEARAAVANGRGNGALRKLGATQEGVLRRSFLRNGQYLDQVLWAIVSTDWSYFRSAALPYVH